MRESCGVIGVFNKDSKAAYTTLHALFALQHRGQESAGISSTDGNLIYFKKGEGLISSVFTRNNIEHLQGFAAIGHTRYSTSGSSVLYNAQPAIVESDVGELALAHNGNLINTQEMQEWVLKRKNIKLKGTSDSEIIAWVYALAEGKDWIERSEFCMSMLKGAYSLTIINKDKLIAVRDPLGIRPLCLGKFGKGGWIVASESPAIDSIGGEFVRDLHHGETLIISEEGITSHIWSKARRRTLCSFEHIYFARADSVIDGQLTYSARVEMGKQLFKEHPIQNADIVVAVPDSAVPAAMGFAEASGIPLVQGIIRNRYIGRTFIEPTKELRELGVQLKFNVIKHIVNGKRLVLVDDSIVRGTTTPHVINMLREAGAKEVHIRVSSPPIVSICHFGVDMASFDELIAAHNTVAEIGEKVGASSIGFLSIDGLNKCIKNSNLMCNGCFTGKYPIDIANLKTKTTDKVA